MDEEEPTRTEIDLSERYEFSQLCADPMTPKLVRQTPEENRVINGIKGSA